MALVSLLIATPALGASKIGVALSIDNKVRATLGAKVRDLAMDDPVFRQEKIETLPGSKAELIFDDFTTLSIGAASTIILDEFVYRPGGTQKITFNTLKGAFRFVTGRARKKAYKVITPTAVIGVRGTDFGVYIDRLGKTLTLLRLGGVRVCLMTHNAAGKSRPSNKCADASEPNTYILTDANQISGPFAWTGTNPFRIIAPPRQFERDDDKGGDNNGNDGGQQTEGGGQSGGGNSIYN